MTESSLPPLLIIADSPDALTDLCGISLLERLRRIVRQLGFGEATLLSNAVASITADLAKTSWHAEDLSLKFREYSRPESTISDVLNAFEAMTLPVEKRALIVSANFCCDGRLLRAVAETQNDSILIDSSPVSITGPLWENSDAHSFGQGPCAAVVSLKWLAEKNRDGALVHELVSDASNGRIAIIDAAQQPAYIPDMRRNIRPIFFPAPSLEHHPLAVRLLLNATQKGVLDFPALVHAPIEKWIVSHLCRTSITPNQVTLGTGVLGICVTLLYGSGYLWPGALLALAVGILDGVDGKLARLKVQTTKIGKGEHALDYCIEMSWWATLAYHFQDSSQVPYAYLILGIFFGADVLERLAKWSVERRLGRSLDDVSRFDRLMRYVAGRRNIYTWLFTLCLLFGAPATGFVLLCAWGVAGAVIHIFRALQIRFAAGGT
jgi:1L-myo-inositol 1-phosphate cytidylyltransferase / CDP-L-myo-inositol myo-inositolphosphotransferase